MTQGLLEEMRADRETVRLRRPLGLGGISCDGSAIGIETGGKSIMKIDAETKWPIYDGLTDDDPLDFFKSSNGK